MDSGDVEALACSCPTVQVRVLCRSISPSQQNGQEGPEKPEQRTELIDAAWHELCAANPRLHDGLILGVDDFEGTSGTFAASPAKYQQLAVQGYTLKAGPLAGATVPDLGVRLLGIKALITANGTDGQDHVLILRRSPEVRVYGNMWEIGPGGGVELPHELSSPAEASTPSTELQWTDLLAALAREATEELGIELGTHCHEPSLHAVYADHIASSCDVVVHCRWKAVVDPKAGWCHISDRDWEYSDAAWLAKADAASWATRAKLISPLARVVLRQWAEQQ